MPEITERQWALLAEAARNLPDPKAEARSYHRCHQEKLTDEQIHDELVETYHKAPPSREQIRQRRGLYAIFGEEWPEISVTFLRDAENYARRMARLDGRHEPDTAECEQLRSLALPLLEEAVRERWTTRQLEIVIRERTKAVVAGTGTTESTETTIDEANYAPPGDGVEVGAGTALGGLDLGGSGWSAAQDDTTAVQRGPLAPPLVVRHSPALAHASAFEGLARATAADDRRTVMLMLGRGVHEMLLGLPEQTQEDLLRLFSETARGKVDEDVA